MFSIAFFTALNTVLAMLYIPCIAENRPLPIATVIVVTYGVIADNPSDMDCRTPLN